MSVDLQGVMEKQFEEEVVRICEGTAPEDEKAHVVGLMFQVGDTLRAFYKKRYPVGQAVVTTALAAMMRVHQKCVAAACGDPN